VMPSKRHRPFTRRHQKAIEAGTLCVGLPDRIRTRIWKTISDYDYPVSYQPNPYDQWTKDTSGLRLLPEILERVYGVESLTDKTKGFYEPVSDVLKPFFLSCTGDQVFDVVELFWANMPNQKNECQRDLNDAMQDNGFHWIFCDGYFLKLDSKWMQDNVLGQAHELLGRGAYDGTLDELREARSYLAADDFKAAKHTAGKSMESLLKAILGLEEGNARKLIDGLKTTNFYDEFPDPLVPGFGDNVLMALPFIRNKLAGHGQGSDVVIVPRSVAELSVNLAGTFLLFLIKRHLEVGSEVVRDEDIQSGSQTKLDDGTPF
jgi:hypothetical protein